jgi:HD-like signal output (HDOD) protein
MATLAERIFGDLETLNDLPSPSPVLVRLSSTLGRADIDLREIEELIGQDPVLAGRLIQAANAAVFAGYGPTSSIRNALLRLGLIRVRRLALMLGLFNAMLASRTPEGFWPQSLGTAVCSEVILRHVTPPKALADPDAIFLAALLHDMGLLVLSSHYRKEDLELLDVASREGKTLDDVEDAVLGIDHGLIGARLAIQWSLPPVVCAAIRGHRRTDQVLPEHRWNTLVVHLADALCRETGIAGMNEAPGLRRDDPALAELGIAPALLPTLTEEARVEVRRATDALAQV